MRIFRSLQKAQANRLKYKEGPDWDNQTGNPVYLIPAAQTQIAPG